MSILSDSKMEDVPVQISVNVVKCYSVAALFEECREKITEIPQIVHDLCRILHCKVRHSEFLCVSSGSF